MCVHKLACTSIGAGLAW